MGRKPHEVNVKRMFASKREWGEFLLFSVIHVATFLSHLPSYQSSKSWAIPLFALRFLSLAQLYRHESLQYQASKQARERQRERDRDKEVI